MRTMSFRRRRRSLVAAVLVTSGIALVACGGGERPAGGDASDTAAPAQAPPSTPTPAAGGADAASPQLVALGDSIFHGQVAGGTCVTCHGQGGAGGPIGPNLADAEWLHGDGSYEFIVGIVTSGVSSPKQFPGIMPPMGGASLTPEQVRAVAAYVASLSRGS